MVTIFSVMTAEVVVMITTLVAEASGGSELME